MKPFVKTTLAGVLTLTLFTSPLQALIVYTPLQVLIVSNGQVYLDINRDAVADFQIVLTSRGITGVCGRGQTYWEINSYIQPLSTPNAIEISAPGQVQFLPLNAEIDASRTFENSRETVYRFNGCGNHGIAGYVGLKFVLNGETRYAWTYVSVGVDNIHQRAQLFVSGYAYEGIPDRGILTGQIVGM